MMISLETGQPSAYFPLRINKSQAQGQEPNSVVPIKFPSTRNVLWESKPVGDFETLALTLPKQAVQLFIVEKSLRLAHRYAEDRRLTSFLLGSVYPKTGEGGVCFGVDRFDPGRELTEKIGENVTKSKVPTAVVPGDHIIPITVKKELLTSDESISHTKDEFSRAIQIMESKICGKDVLTLSHVVSLKANLYCCRKQDELIITLHCGAIVPDLKFQARPIAPLAIIPTTLARNLTGPLRLSDVEGTPKMGYVTMDQTRKLLLLLESDPKAYNLPLIGIWISGVHNVHHPYVWASCLRYLNCCEIKDRVLHSSGSFLLLHYSTVQKIPDFWECFLDNNEKLDFELLSCQESLHLDLDDCRSKEPLCFHLTPSPTGMNKALFDEAIAEWKNDGITLRNIEQNVDDNHKDHSKSSGLTNDDSPRPTPSPHPSPTQVKTPNAPAPEESLSLSFDEASSNFDKNPTGRSRENTKTLAPRFKQTPNTKPMNPMSNKSDSFKISRQPFKQITPQDQGNSPSSLPGRGKAVVPSRSQASRKGENKENTPLTSRNVPQGNVHRKSPGGGTGKHFEPRSRSVSDVHQEKTLLSDRDSSNPRMPVKLATDTRQRHRSEGFQSYQMQRPAELNRTRANSLALSDDDSLNDISLDSSLTKNNEIKRLSNQSPTKPNRPTQPSPSHHNHSPKPLPSNCECSRKTSAPKQVVYVDRSPYSNQPSKSDSCKLQYQQSPRGDGNADTRQNSPKISCNVRHSFGDDGGGDGSYSVGGDRTSPSSHSAARRRSRSTSDHVEQQYVGGRNPQSTNPNTRRSAGITFDNDGRQLNGGRTANPRNNDTAQRRISETDFQQSLPNHSDNGSPRLSHGNAHLKPSSVSGKRPSSTSSAIVTGTTSLDKNSGNSIQQQSPSIYDDDQHHISPSRASKDSFQQSSSHNDLGNPKVEDQGNAGVILEQEAKEEKLSSNKELEDQVKRQEDMIRVLQEQVRSLLRVKEAISSDSDRPSLPLTPVSTPASTPVSNTSPKRREEQKTVVSQAIDGKQQPERVTIGVNTGASLLWETSRDNSGSCEQCCECKRPRPQSDQSQQDVPDSEPPEHPDVFLTPEKTESLIDPSQVDVEVDSTHSSTPAISNMMIPSMSAEDESLLSNQAVSTSQTEESTNENEVPVKGREFYDKLLCQVKDLLSDQVGTEQENSASKRQVSQLAHVPTREVVVKATLRQLEKIKHSEQDATQQSPTRLPSESSGVFSTYHQRSLSTSFIPEHPRLNYVSMSVDDTFDEVTYIDEVALKYLSDEELKQFKSEVRPSPGAAAVKRSFTRTVRFGSLPSDNERRSLSRRSLREVDFTWNNLSFCTKNYLTKYNLVEGQVSFAGEDEGQGIQSKDKEKVSRETSLDTEPCKPPFPSPAHHHSQDSSHILDIKRLKNLPKLF